MPAHVLTISRHGEHAIGEREMSDVSVIGLGAMGSALARALLRGGHSVTVWNRTDTKAAALGRDGASVAPHPAAAVVASPVVVVCVENYDVTRAVLAAPDVRPQLSGRVVVQLSTGRPEEARDGERWVRESEADYLDGAILAYPEQIGTPEAALLVAGPEATFRRCEPLLQCLAGGLTFVGERIGSASALDCASLSLVFGALLGALHGARICEVEGLRVDEFASMMSELMPVVGVEVGQLGGRIQAGRFDGSHSALRTYDAAAMRLLQHARDSRINADLPAYVSATLRKGVTAGFGSEDLAALIKVLRTDV
jgi:3-hydroxyisobutyrate dehydrogenase-like beta-hydroxyacid dehydrogenase